MSERFFEAAVQLPQFLSASLMRVAEGEAARITEIRLRSGRPVLLTLPEGGRYLLPDGALEEREGGRSVPSDPRAAERVFSGAVPVFGPQL